MPVGVNGNSCIREASSPNAQGAPLNLLVNGDFETSTTPGCPTKHVHVGAGFTGLAGWLVTRDAIDIVGCGWQQNGGQLSLDLDGSPGRGGVAQVFPTLPNTWYAVSFDLAGNSDWPPVVKSMRVEAAGRQADFTFDTSSTTLQNMGWVRRHWRFLAVDTNTRIEFYSLSPAVGFGGAGLDNVVVTAEAPIDSDDDGLTDADEVAVHGTNPQDPDTDDDGLLDGTEVDVANGTGCPSPLKADSDGDGLNDGAELLTIGTDPCRADTDSDGLGDAVDPLPTTPGATPGVLASLTCKLGKAIQQANPAEFVGPSVNASRGRQQSLGIRVCSAADRIAAGDGAAAIALLITVLVRLDDQEVPPDWMVPGAVQDAFRQQIEVILFLLAI